MHGSFENPTKTSLLPEKYSDGRSLHRSRKRELTQIAKEALSATLLETGIRYAGTEAGAFGSKHRRPHGWHHH